MAFSGHPVSTWIAIRGGELLGFACADATAKGFFGPTGVRRPSGARASARRCSLRRCAGLREVGYAYAIIGGAGPVEFYRKRLDAIEIPGSAPGIYRGMLRAK